MNDARSPNGKMVPISVGLKTALVVGVLGFIVAVADKSNVTLPAVHATAPDTPVASFNNAALSADGPAPSTMPQALPLSVAAGNAPATAAEREAWPGCRTDRSARSAASVPPAVRSRRADTDLHRDHGRRR